MREIGRITSAWRYPVKSMAGERLATANVTLQGIMFDRWYAFVEAPAGGPRAFFPWVTGREVPPLLRYEPRWVATDGRPALHVATPSGDVYPIMDERLRREVEAAYAKPVTLVPNYRGNFDVAAITLISNATVRGIAEASGTPEEPLRFRMNFYIETERSEPFNEDALVGKTVRLGETVRVAITERDKRCAMVTLAPHGSTPVTPVLAAIANLNETYAGVYGSVLTPGEVREGDPVTVED
jgi:uncharacterized protein YcbX